MSRQWLVGVTVALFVIAFGLLPLYADSLFESEVPESTPEPTLPADPCPENNPQGKVRHPNEYTDQSAPYTGPGPHSMVLVNAVSDVDGIFQGYSVDDRLLPAEWGVYDDDESTKAQLIVCEYAVSVGAFVRTCEYVGDGGAHNVQLMRASYAYRVFEARTAKPVTEFTLDSGEICPSSIELWNGGSPPDAMLQSADFDELANALRPFVDP